MSAELERGARELGVTLSADQLELIQVYVELLQKWNKTVNLVSRRDVGRLIPRHILDSLTGVKLLQGQQILDLGTGAGLPGMVLAIASPQRHFVLCDRMSRRVRFLQQVRLKLGLNNVEILEADASSDDLGRGLFDTVVARGVATPLAVWDMVHSRLTAQGSVLVYESTRCAENTDQQDELDAEVSPELYIARHYFDIPGLDEPHCIVRLQRGLSA